MAATSSRKIPQSETKDVPRQDFITPVAAVTFILPLNYFLLLPGTRTTCYKRGALDYIQSEYSMDMEGKYFLAVRADSIILN